MFNTTTPTLLPQTLSWGSFRANDNRQPTLIFSNTLKLNFTGLTENTTYNWTTKVQKGMANDTAIDPGNFTTGAGETTYSLNIYLTAGLYNVGCTYYFGLAEAVQGGEEGIQFDFKIDNRVTLDTNGGVISGQLINQAFSYSGESFDVSTNRFLDEKILELNNITVFTNLRIPTNLAVQTFVNNAIQGFDLNGNTSFDDLELRVSTNESDITDLQTDKMDKAQNLNDVADKTTARDNLDVYRRITVDTKDSNTLTSANNFTTSAVSTLDGQLGTVAKSNNYNDLNNKPDLTVLEEVLVFPDLASFPVTGETQKVYIAQDTGFMYRWSGSAYIQLTDQTAIWGEISGTLSNQTDLQNALNGKVNNTGDETINGVKTFGSIPVLPSSNPTNANQSTRKGYVDGLDGANVKLTGNQTVAGTKTFSSPVGVPSPVAGGDAVNRSYLAENIQPQVITNSLINYRARLIAGSPTYIPTDQQIVAVKKDLENNMANHGVLPAYRLDPLGSFKQGDPSSTRVYNTGSFNGGDGTIINGTVGTMVTDRITFTGASSQSISTGQMFSYPNFTWLVWVDITTGTGDFMSNQGATTGVRFNRLVTGDIRFFLADNVNNATFQTCQAPFANNQRALIVGTAEQAVGTKLYIGTTDGLTLASTVNQSIANFTPNTEVLIGRSASGVFLTGSLFKVMIIPQTLSQTEIQRIFNSERAFYQI